jgi:hypothetical protein
MNSEVTFCIMNVQATLFLVFWTYSTDKEFHMELRRFWKASSME